MTEYRHHVSGFFVKREEAQIALTKLNSQGIPLDRLGIYDNETAIRKPAPDANASLGHLQLKQKWVSVVFATVNERGLV